MLFIYYYCYDFNIHLSHLFIIRHKDIFISNVLVMVLVVINNTKIIIIFISNIINDITSYLFIMISLFISKLCYYCY